MELSIKRFSDNGESTLSIMYMNNTFFGFVLEDTYREIKKMHETCIPQGRYRVDYNPNVTPMTNKYRKKYAGFFTNHLMLQNVPFFENVYIHVGNSADDSSGCLLVGNKASSNADRDGFIGDSVNCFKKVYKSIAGALDKGEDVFITISEVFQR